MHQRLIELKPSPANCFEYCIGTLGEMPEGDLYAATESYARQGRLGYISATLQGLPAKNA